MVFENNCLRGLAGKTRGDKCRMTYLRNVLSLGPNPQRPGSSATNTGKNSQEQRPMEKCDKKKCTRI